MSLPSPHVYHFDDRMKFKRIHESNSAICRNSHHYFKARMIVVEIPGSLLQLRLAVNHPCSCILHGKKYFSDSNVITFL